MEKHGAIILCNVARKYISDENKVVLVVFVLLFYIFLYILLYFIH